MRPIGSRLGTQGASALPIGAGCRHRLADTRCDNGDMTESAEPNEVQGWSPAPDEGQAGTVMTNDGQWAYRYKDGAELILMKMPERPATT